MAEGFQNPFVNQLEGLLEKAQTAKAEGLDRAQQNFTEIIAELKGIRQALEAIATHLKGA